MAIIIDFGGKEQRKETPVSAVTDPDKPATIEAVDRLTACRHPHCVISEEKRTVTCQDCKQNVDPYAYILKLYGYYETRIDQRLAALKEAERRDAERRERESWRKREPRRAKVERRRETAERAAWNEYQAKVLAARAERQRQLVGKLDAEIAAMPPEPPQPKETGEQAK